MSWAPTDRAAEELKRCCAVTYGLDIVPALLGESYHPGGIDLTRRLARAVGLQPGMRVAEFASGPGTTATTLAEEFGVRVIGLELGAESAARATHRARSEHPGARVSFVVADAERAPLWDGSVDAVFCECAFCTFPDKARGASEMARLLAAGGRVGLADVVVEPGRLPPRLQSAAAWIGCLAGALAVRDYERILKGAGLRTIAVEPHHDALAAMIDAVEARLIALRLAGVPLLAAVDPDGVREVASSAREAVADGVAGYVLMVAEKS
jgi:SAM-dependent methyltransferase